MALDAQSLPLSAFAEAPLALLIWLKWGQLKREAIDFINLLSLSLSFWFFWKTDTVLKRRSLQDELNFLPVSWTFSFSYLANSMEGDWHCSWRQRNYSSLKPWYYLEISLSSINWFCLASEHSKIHQIVICIYMMQRMGSLSFHIHCFYTTKVSLAEKTFFLIHSAKLQNDFQKQSKGTDAGYRESFHFSHVASCQYNVCQRVPSSSAKAGPCWWEDETARLLIKWAIAMGGSLEKGNSTVAIPSLLSKHYSNDIILNNFPGINFIFYIFRYNVDLRANLPAHTPQRFSPWCCRCLEKFKKKNTAVEYTYISAHSPSAILTLTSYYDMKKFSGLTSPG